MYNSPFSLKWLIVPLLLFLAFIPFSAELDLFVSSLFFDKKAFDSSPFWDFMFHYGIWPAWMMVAAACTALLLSCSKKRRYLAKPALYLLITFAIGSGLIIHAGLKEHWGRPRPVQTIDFGGLQPFRPLYKPQFFDQPEPSKSFSCGHCSLGFCFFALALLGAVWKSKPLYWTGFVAAWVLGFLLSLARIAKGGHYLSDTLASALIMWIVAYAIGYYFFSNRSKRESK